jgi:heterotetrameric sarcosine oxidase gamma subunit
VSAPEGPAEANAGSGVQIADCPADIVEIAALRGGAPALQEVASRRAAPLPPRGRVGLLAGGLILSVRPERWLILFPPAAPGAVAQSWAGACAGCGVALELSSALTALHVSGAAVREVLKRGCRLDLEPPSFPTGSAAATIIVQVPVVLAALASGVLLLTPSSTARHFREWLAAAARPFGLMPYAGVTVAFLSEKGMT